MRRSQRDAASGTRKAAKALRMGRTVSGAGPSLLESLEEMLLDVMSEYASIKYLSQLREDNVEPKKLGLVRGEVRGLARAIAKIRLPYEDQRIVIKQIEKEFLRKVKNDAGS